MLDVLFSSPESGPNTLEDSHLHLELLEDGEPEQARFTYVDEHTCIGCTYCASIARNTFFSALTVFDQCHQLLSPHVRLCYVSRYRAVEEDHGRARVYNQASLLTHRMTLRACPVRTCV